MGLLFQEQFELDGWNSTDGASRRSFRAGIKAAFIVSQLNRLGQVLCAGCGFAWSDLVLAFNELELEGLSETGTGYAGGVDMGVDHPNNLVLKCFRCIDKAATVGQKAC
jgi:hypothetical protein